MAFRSWLKKIWIAKRIGSNVDDYGNVTPTYDVPIELSCNVQPVSGNTEIMAYGERIFHMYRAMLDTDKWYGKFDEGDLGYLDGRTPDGETVNGELANYRIVSVRTQNFRIAVYFEKLQKGV